jgi:hypothetical protein
MSLENDFAVACVVIEAALIFLLIRGRVWRALPVFFTYCVCAFISDTTASSLRIFSRDSYGIGYYFVATAIDLALQLAVLVEIAWSVLRPLRERLSPKALLLVAALILIAGAAIWPLARIPGLQLPQGMWRMVVQLQQTVSILRILFFVLLAACSHLLSIGWRNRELQVATGFGFYSLVSLAIAGVNTHQTSALQISRLTWIVAFSFLFSLLYWIYSFAHKEAQRQAFTPQMQSVLLRVAETAHITRVSLSDLPVTNPQKRDRR